MSPHESPQKIQQEDTCAMGRCLIETKCTTAELEAAGIGQELNGVGHRKRSLLKDHIASYTLDNKASVAIL